MSYSRWATKEEIIEHATRITKEDDVKKSGITLMYDDDSLYINDSELHSLVIGGTGSGKTQTTIMPQLYLSIKAGESFIVNDHDGELFNIFSGMAKEADYNVQVINFRDMNTGNNYNPLCIPYKMYKEEKIDEAVQILENVGYNLLSDFNQTDTDPFWENSAISLFTGLALYLFSKAKPDEVNINSIVNLSYKLDDISKELTDKSSVIYTYLSTIVDAPQDTRGSILSVFRQKISLITSRSSLTKLLSNNNIDLEHVKSEKSAIFVISDDKYSRIFMPMILGQVYDIIRINHQREGKLNIILDEFGTMKPIKNFLDILTYSRSAGIRITIVVQSILHLENIYGAKNTEFIRLAVNNTIFLLSYDNHTLELISRECGRTSENTLLVNIEELKVLKNFEAIILTNRMYPIKTKLLPYYQMGIKEIEPIELNPLEYNNIKIYQ